MRLSLCLRRLVCAVVAMACALPALPFSPEREVPLSERGAASKAPGIAMEALSRPLTGDLDAMVERGEIRVLTCYDKSFYFVSDGAARGLACDAARLFEESLNKKLADDPRFKGKSHKIRVVFVPVARERLWQALADGRGDIVVSGQAIPATAPEQVVFSTPVHADLREWIVSGPDAPALATANDLSGREVFVRRLSPYYENLVALSRRLTAAGQSGVIIQEVSETLTDEDLLAMTAAGLIPRTVVNEPVLRLWKPVLPGLQTMEGAVFRTGDSIAWAVRKDSPLLLAAVNEFIEHNHKALTTPGSRLTRYLKGGRYVQHALSESDHRNLMTLAGTFRKYGEQYGVDWLLLAAKGYHESQFRQSARGRSGAIGVMQVLSATGRRLNVGDIRKTESNVHAAAKYLRTIIDQFYGDPQIANLDKALFAVASYNVGPSRIAPLRAQAAKRGLNPNVWFGNVEHVAAEKIGREVANYVACVYIYYLTYDRILRPVPGGTQ